MHITAYVNVDTGAIALGNTYPTRELCERYTTINDLYWKPAYRVRVTLKNET